jgi:hypothetical protein
MATLSSNGEHPIYELMERAEERWEGLLAGQSKSLEDAVREYRKRYHIPPPLGFDTWFTFCQENGVQIVDNYDQLMKDLLPHHALEPEVFVKRSNDLEGGSFTYTLDISEEGVELSGERAWSARPKHFEKLINGFRGSLPKGFKLKVTGSDHDTGSTVLGKDQRDRAMELVRTGERESVGRWGNGLMRVDFDETELKQLEDPKRTPAFGWFVSIAHGSHTVADRQ